mmetsp:Transcript_14813/g.31763  ORF Transcript_14813/g.31763 Transcript_14813/m.31763 type:complete len:241 (-) Transcript_14813:178-900(-)
MWRCTLAHTLINTASIARCSNGRWEFVPTKRACSSGTNARTDGCIGSNRSMRFAWISARTCSILMITALDRTIIAAASCLNDGSTTRMSRRFSPVSAASSVLATDRSTGCSAGVAPPDAPPIDTNGAPPDASVEEGDDVGDEHDGGDCGEEQEEEEDVGAGAVGVAGAGLDGARCGAVPGLKNSSASSVGDTGGVAVVHGDDREDSCLACVNTLPRRSTRRDSLAYNDAISHQYARCSAR